MEELILKEREVKEQIAQLVSSSGLPAVMLKPMFKDFLEQLNAIEEQQYSLALKNKEEKNTKTVKKGEK